MASITQDELYRMFLEVAGSQASDSTVTQALLSEVLAQYRQVQSSVPAPAAAATTTSRQTTTDNGGSTVGSIASTILKSGLGVAPLVTGLIHLFGGGGEPEAPPALVKYALPESVHFEAARSGSRLSSVDYDQSGLARTMSSARDAGAGKVESTTTSPQITVNVQAMDARSFLDRSNDIALAVRDAMLNLNAINDVVNDL